MTAMISDKVKVQLETRKNAAIAAAQASWRELAEKIVSGGELTGKEVDKLEDLGRVLDIDDVFERLQADAELIASVRGRRERLGDAQKKADAFLADAEAATKELERIRAEVIPKLWERQANGTASGTALICEMQEIDRVAKGRPDLFPESATPARK